jgi:hypothetical protein
MNCYEERFAVSIDNKLFDSINHHEKKNNYQTLISNYIPAPKQENDCSIEKLQVVHDKYIVLKRQINDPISGRTLAFHLESCDTFILFNFQELVGSWGT